MPNQRSRTSAKKAAALKTFPCQARAFHDAITAALEGSDSFRDRYLQSEMLSKYANPDKESQRARKEKAIAKMLSSEAKNKTTNQRFAELSRNPPTKFVQAVLHRARQIISDVIGEVNYDLFQRCGFSGGASTSRRRQPGVSATKFEGQGDVTLSAYPYLKAFLATHPNWAGSEGHKIRVVEGNIVFTVPKNNEIDRAAAKEPDYNMFLQKAVGNHVRSCLRRVGVDLNDQTVNQRLACDGSRDGSLATLDLSAASDSVTTGLIMELFPFPWVELMFALRSPRAILPGSKRNEYHEWEMLSSMGNGFTFEVESLVFYALIRAVTHIRGIPGKISVYGDDLIVPTQAVSGVRRILRFCGFEMNTEKSFYSGDFRESCGEHYMNGENVTPFYIREPICNAVRMIHVLNSLRSWASWNGIADARVEHVWREFSKRVPRCVFGGDDCESILSLASPRIKGGGHTFARMESTVDLSSNLGAYFASLFREPRVEHAGLAKRMRSVALSECSRPSSKYRINRRRTYRTEEIPLFPSEIPDVRS